MSKRCPRCSKAVYLAEEKIGAGQSWHVSCFLCASCHTGLDSTTLAENKGEIYCKACHVKNFGPKGYGYGGGAGVLTMTGVDKDASGGQPVEAKRGPFCPQCGAGAQQGKFCSECGATVDAASKPPPLSAAPRGAFEAPAQSLPKPQARSSSLIMPSSNPKCPACGQAVYHAERVIGAGSEWHKACFKCATCSKGLDSTTVVDRERQIYCRACYAKQFGPKGYGYGQGAGALKLT